MFQSVRDKASLAELAVVGSHPATVRVRLDTKEAKEAQNGAGDRFLSRCPVGCRCVLQTGWKFVGNHRVFGESERPVALFPCLRPVHVGLTAGLTGLT